MAGAIHPETDAVRAEVDRITASPGFAKSERLNRFLRLIVEETLAGRGDQIKEYPIGAQVYARPQNYDPRTDAIVRVEATKLRKRLASYYEGEGRNDALVIRVPKGGYRPEFEYRSNRPVAAAGTRGWRLPMLASTVVLLTFLGAIGLWVVRRGGFPRLAHQRLISTFPGSHHDASFSPDGAMIAYVDTGADPDHPGVSEVWVKALYQGLPIQITFGGPDAVRPLWSSRGDQIVFERTGQGIWSVPPLGGPARRIVEDGRHASISPGGSNLLFVRRREIWIAEADGTAERRLEGVPERFLPMETPPAYSPDGRSIAFFNAEVGPLGDIWVIPASGGHPHRVTSDQSETRGLVWSRNGRWIIFSSARAGSFTLWRVPSAGGAAEPITTGAGEDLEPEISPDGKRLIYTNARTSWSLMVRDPASGVEKELFAQRELIGFPSFAPDGKTIAYFQPVNGDPHLFLASADGSQRQQISHGKGQEISPAWSGDGSSLYFYAVKPQLSFRKLAIFGGTMTDVAAWAYGVQNWARIDSLGRTAVYTQVGPKGPVSTFLRDMPTGRERRLAATLTRSQWSPDSQFILGEGGSRDNAGGHITICRAIENQCREVTGGIAPKWSADGLRIYFLRSTARPGWFDLWSASRDGSDPLKIAALGPFRADEINFDVSAKGQVIWAPTRIGRQELWLAELD